MPLRRVASLVSSAASKAASAAKEKQKSSSSSSSGNRSEVVSGVGKVNYSDGVPNTIGKMSGSYDPSTGQYSITDYRTGQTHTGSAGSQEEYRRIYDSIYGGGGGGGGGGGYSSPNLPIGGINFNQYRTQTATIEDLQRKYGFDYSREYAARQAEAEARARRDAIANQQRGVEANVEGSVDALDRNYFLQGLQQQQAQANRGLNAGIAADQNLRMAMSRQAAMGDIYRDANLERMRLLDELGRVEVERLAREDALFNERLQQGFLNALALTDAERASNQQMIDALLAQRGQDINQYQFGEDYRLREGALTGNYLSNEARNLLDQHMRHKQQTEARWMDMTPEEREAARRLGDEQRRQLALLGLNVSADWSMSDLQRQLAGGSLGQTLDSRRLQQEDQHFLARLDWEREQFNNLSAAEKEQFAIARERLEEEKRQFDSELEWREYEFNNMSAREQAEMLQRIEEFGAELAWRQYEFEETMRMTEAQMYYNAGLQGGQSPSSNVYDSRNFLE